MTARRKPRPITYHREPDTYRICSVCGKAMTSGFVVDDGLEHYCTKKCLQKKYTMKKYDAMYAQGNAYWTQWV